MDLFTQIREELSNVAKDSSKLVIRRESKGWQEMKQAIRSACLGAASAIQKGVYRQLGNFPIQSAGAICTKIVMSSLWDQLGIPMMNVHDEIIVPKEYEDYYERAKETVSLALKELEKTIPYLTLDWKKIKTWAEK